MGRKLLATFGAFFLYVLFLAPCAEETSMVPEGTLLSEAVGLCLKYSPRRAQPQKQPQSTMPELLHEADI